VSDDLLFTIGFFIDLSPSFFSFLAIFLFFFAV